jgi:hypothetical protein
MSGMLDDAQNTAVSPVPQDDAFIYFEIDGGLTGAWSHHYHPNHTDFRIDCYLKPQELPAGTAMPYPGIAAYLPFEGRTIYFRFSDCPKNVWVSFHDEDGGQLPFQIFRDGSVRIIGRWLPLS